VEKGLADLSSGDPNRRVAGLHNVVVFGRAVTNVLQNLRSTEPDFDAWYAPHLAEMEGDPLLKYLYTLRSDILKKGVLPVGVSTYIRQLRFPQDAARLGPPPPNARGFFIGDSLGGSGWEVELADGRTEKYYAKLPADVGATTLHLPDAPVMHMGQPLKGNDVTTIGRAYVAYLRKLVTDAEQQFAPSKGTA
jgi:hypothetical protein